VSGGVVRDGQRRKAVAVLQRLCRLAMWTACRPGLAAACPPCKPVPVACRVAAD
jgi:hypothetical protein